MFDETEYRRRKRGRYIALANGVDFLGKTASERQSAYRQLFNAQISSQKSAEIRQAINKSNVPGSDENIRKMGKG